MRRLGREKDFSLGRAPAPAPAAASLRRTGGGERENGGADEGFESEVERVDRAGGTCAAAAGAFRRGG